MGRDIYGTISIEAGGLNSMIPLALAARLGLPVVDADGMVERFLNFKWLHLLYMVFHPLP